MVKFDKRNYASRSHSTDKNRKIVDYNPILKSPIKGV